MSTLPSHPADQSAVPASQQPGTEAAGTEGPTSLPKVFAPLGSDPAIRASTPPAILEAQRVFLQDLPELLQMRRGQWVAYYGTERLGFGITKETLWQECCARGYDEFLIRCIEPHVETDFISAL